MKKWIIGIVLAALLAVIGFFAIPIIILTSVLPGVSQSSLTDGACVNYQVGSNIPVNGLTAEASANAVIIVQEAMRRGLGKDAAEVGVLAAMTESNMSNKSGGDNHTAAYPEYDWSWGMFQTKLWDQFPEAWDKPGGGKYPKSDPASIERAKAMALNPQTAASWFFHKLSGDHPSTKSLANFKWRTRPIYRGKPWVLAQKIEQSAFADGRNYKEVWFGARGVTPREVVETILNSDLGEDNANYDGTTFTTLSTAFPNLEVDAEGKFVIPGPANARTSDAGYPVLKNRPKWLSEVALPSGSDTQVAKWSQGAFEDLITRWQSSSVLTENYSLAKNGAKIQGWSSYFGPAMPSNFNTGTAVRLLPGTLKAPKQSSGQIGPVPAGVKTGGVTPEEQAAIEKIIRDMGGVLKWGGTSDPGYFYISPDLRPETLEGWASAATQLGQPPYFFVGDSIGRSIGNLVTKNLPQSTVDAADSRKTGKGISILRTSSQAKIAKTWIVELGTNDANNPTAFREYIDKVMTLAGPNRQVFWVDAYRPTTHPMGDAIENNRVLREAANQYQNLKVIDWHNKAITNQAWFADDNMKLHPNTDGKQALMDLILAAVTGNGNGTVSGISFLCGGGSGMVANEEYVVESPVPSGRFVDNPTKTAPDATAIVNRALAFVGNPPSSCPYANCYHSCLHIASRAWGRGASGIDSARIALGMYRKAGVLVEAKNPDGSKNPAAYEIPIGALVFWDPSPSGHVATYVGNGMVMSNGNWGKGDNLYLAPMEAFDGYGNGYEGYTTKPIWGS